MTESLPPGVEIRAADDALRAPLIELFNLCFDKDDGERVVPWRYDANPAGQAISQVACEGETILSSYGCFPRRVLHRGEEVDRSVVGQTGDVMTHPDHRGRGVFSHLDRSAMSESSNRGWPCVIGLPNRKSAPIFTGKLGWKEVGKVRPWTFVLHPDSRAKAERMRAGRLASAVVPWTYFRGVRARGRLRDKAFDKVHTVAIPRFGEDVDSVTREVAKSYSWMVDRNHEFLNWRFLDAPSQRFRAHGVYDASGDLRGYSVVQLPERGEAAGYVVDLVGLDDVAVAGAMEAALGHLHKAGAAVARAFAVEGSFWEKALRSSGFRAPKADDYKLIIAWVNDESHPLGKAVLDPAGWFATDADRDDELVS